MSKRKTRGKTSVRTAVAELATTVCATAMLTVGAIAMFLTWGMLVVAGFASTPRAAAQITVVGGSGGISSQP